MVYQGMGSFQKYILWDGARGPLVAMTAMSGMRMYREVRLRPGGFQPETWADAEVEIVDERDTKQNSAAANDATGSKTANATGNSAGDAATEKDATMRRVGELHRLLDSRKGSLNATCRKNTDANDKAYDLNHKSFQALDALAKEYVDFEAASLGRSHAQLDEWRAGPRE